MVATEKRIWGKAEELAQLQKMVDLAEQTEEGSYLRSFFTPALLIYLQTAIRDDVSTDLYAAMQYEAKEKNRAQETARIEMAKMVGEVEKAKAALTQAEGELASCQMELQKTQECWRKSAEQNDRDATTFRQLYEACTASWWNGERMDPTQVRNIIKQ